MSLPCPSSYGEAVAVLSVDVMLAGDRQFTDAHYLLRFLSVGREFDHY